MSFKFLHGVHVPHNKNTSENKPVPMVVSDEVTIPVSMHIGAPAIPVVKPGDEVKVGQMIAEAGGFVSSPVYSSVSGTIKAIDEVLTFNGSKSKAIIIKTDGQQTPYENLKAPEVNDLKSFLEAVRNSGVVGLGGAGFPTAVKLSADPEKVEYICINGAECEPYITTDTRVMMDDTDLLVHGIEMLQEYLAPKTVFICIEDNKPQCISKLNEAVAGMQGVEVKELPSVYPQGGEKVLIYNVTGRIVSEGQLPIDVGCIVINTTTLASLTRYIETGKPLVEKYVTVDGSAVKNPQNVIVPIGTKMLDVVAFTGGFRSLPKKIIMGGPMMGIANPDIEAPVIKNTNAIICLDSKDATPPPVTPCIKCGRCLAHCPLNLMPAYIERAYNLNRPEELKELKVNLCMECGCCAFSCPAKRPLVQTHKLAKVMLNKYNAELKAAAEAAKKAEEENEKEGTDNEGHV